MADASRLLEESSTGEVTRAPLIVHTNTISPPSSLNNRRQLRRKISFKRHIDSSEEFPSSHDSLFDAEYFSGLSSEDSNHDPNSWQYSSLSSIALATSPPSHIENSTYLSQNLTPIIGSTRIIYGHGTPLATIVEQQSKSTIRSAITPEMVTAAGHSNKPSPFPFIPRPRSISDLTHAIARDAPHLIDQHEYLESSQNSPLRTSRRQYSLTVSDLATIQRSYHDALTEMIKPSQHILEIAFLPPSENTPVYASPLTPLIPPIERPTTPPGYPSWTEAQNRGQSRNIRSGSVSVAERALGIQPAPNLFQRFFGIEPSSIEISTPVSMPPIQQIRDRMFYRTTRNASAPVASLLGSSGAQAPRFRPPRSMHGTASLQSHPFANAPLRAVSAPVIIPESLPAATNGLATYSSRFTTNNSISSIPVPDPNAVNKWEQLNTNGDGVASVSALNIPLISDLPNGQQISTAHSCRERSGGEGGGPSHYLSNIVTRGRRTIQQKACSSTSIVGMQSQVPHIGQLPDIRENIDPDMRGQQTSQPAEHVLEQYKRGTRKTERKGACPHREARRASLKALRVDELASNETSNVSGNMAMRTAAVEAYSQNPRMEVPEPGLREVISENNRLIPNVSGDNIGVPVGESSRDPSTQDLTQTSSSNQRCWKCHRDHVVNKIDKLWEASTEWGVFYCCSVVEDTSDERMKEGRMRAGGVGGGISRLLIDGFPGVIL
jgi:hypothetical protein